MMVTRLKLDRQYGSKIGKGLYSCDSAKVRMEFDAEEIAALLCESVPPQVRDELLRRLRHGLKGVVPEKYEEST